MSIKLTNFAYSTLASGISAVDTMLSVAIGHGDRFPSLGAGEYFYATLDNGAGVREIVKVTARAVDSFTIVRAQDNTVAQSWLAGDSVALRLNVATFEDKFDTRIARTSATGSAVMPSGTTAQRDGSPAQGYLRANTDLNRMEWWNGAQWVPAGDVDVLTALRSINGGQLAGMRNKFINGAIGIDQRNAGAEQTITAAAALAYTVDRWYAYCTGANVTGQRVAGTAPNKFNYRFTGAASVTKIGFAQRIEAVNCQDLAGQTATLSVDLANSLLTTVTWTAWYANTEDTFGTLASPTRTQIATGTFTVSSTLTRYSTQISIPSAATTGIEVEFSVGAQTSGTWTIGRAQLEVGGVATLFEHRPIGTELALCQRYFVTGIRAVAGAYAAGASLTIGQSVTLPQVPRATPTYAQTANGSVNLGAISYAATANSQFADITASTAGAGNALLSTSFSATMEL